MEFVYFISFFLNLSSVDFNFSQQEDEAGIIREDYVVKSLTQTYLLLLFTKSTDMKLRGKVTEEK
jgi:hypothetical protein